MLRTRQDRIGQPKGISLKAANNSTISTYGRRELTLDIGLHCKFGWSFSIAEFSQPILGADLLRHFRMLVDLANSCLVDTETSLTVPAQVSNLTPLQINHISTGVRAAFFLGGGGQTAYCPTLRGANNTRRHTPSEKILKI